MLVILLIQLKQLDFYQMEYKLNNIFKKTSSTLDALNHEKEFNKYIYTPTPKNWDCSSRLIRECVAYGKKVLFTRNSTVLLDTNYGLKYLIKKFNLL